MNRLFCKLLMVAAAATTSVSCSGIPSEYVVSTTEIGGEMGKYFKLVDKVYPDCGEESDYYDVLIKLQVEKIAEIPYDKATLHAYNTYYDLNHESIKYKYNFGFDLFDEDGVLLAKFPATQENNNCIFSYDEIEELRNIAVGESGFVKVKYDYKDLSEDDLKRVVSLRLTSTLDNANGTPITTSSSGGADWDGLLDEFDNYVDRYIALMRKSKGGDMSALTDAMSLLESAQSLGTKFESASGSLSSSQMSRYVQIAQKLSSAAISF